MGKVTDSSTGEEPYIKACQCAACNTTFEKRSRDVVETARAVAEHWNENHSDILENSYTPYQKTEEDRRELADRFYQARTKVHYLTVYDVLAIDDGDDLFDSAFVGGVLLNEFCEDCLTPVERLDEYEELDDQDDAPVTKYLCRQCKRDRKITRRKENNKQLTAFERA